VPLSARNRELGVLVIGREPERPFRMDEVGLVEDLARRAGLAIDNARLFSDRASVAATLQASLLPAALPEVEGVDTGVTYAAAGEGLEVGGDFYDLLEVDGGLRFAVGDVCGKGAGAAAVTGIARQTLRLLGRRGLPLPEVLEQLNTAILDEGERSRFVTLLYGEMRPRGDGGADLELCCAGHPPPMLMSPEGVRQIGKPQPLLGVMDDVLFTTDLQTLGAGDTLVCVTDGVTERRNGDRMLGEDGLARVLSGATARTAQALADRIEEAVVGFAEDAPRDDIAVLVLRLRPTRV
jgi:serine phosphatase RsbU (regulator of sigma subunit)